MNDDLISRSALKKEFDDKCAFECAICKYAKDFAPCKLIDNAPTIERPRPTIERPRGEWVKNNDTVFINRFNCSLCGRLIFEPKDKNNFCPKCGAYMRGGRK